MDKYELSKGRGRTRVNLTAYYLGTDLVLCIHNQNAHVGAVAVAEYCHEEKRASTSVLTRLGHKDDALAMQAAHAVCKAIQKSVCVIAGVHLDRITESEIGQILENSSAVVQEFIDTLLAKPG